MSSAAAPVEATGEGLTTTVPATPGRHVLLPRWKPGESGNPGGRSKRFFEVQSLAREGSPKSMLRLLQLVESDDERVAIIASNSVLDRAFGKPKEQKTDENQQVKPDLSALDPADLAQLRLLMAKLALAASQG